LRFFLTILVSVALAPTMCSASDEGSVRVGAELFKSSCVACHGLEGKGDGPAAKAMTKQKPRNFVTGTFKYGNKKSEIIRTLKSGIEGTPMPSWKHLDEEQLEALADYVISLRAKQ
jgi:cytochrome c oxidase cbb3-type subunit I/II